MKTFKKGFMGWTCFFCHTAVAAVAMKMAGATVFVCADCAGADAMEKAA